MGQQGDEIHIIAHRRRFADDPEEYARKLEEQREYNHIPQDVPRFSCTCVTEPAKPQTATSGGRKATRLRT